MAKIRAVIIGAVIAGTLGGPAFAQDKQEKEPLVLEAEQKKKEADANDKQYKSTLDRTRKNGGASEVRANDPWQNMRGADDGKTKR